MEGGRIMEKPGQINVLALLAERKIQQAMDEGAFDNLPGRGRPQELEDLSHLPEDLRLVWRILKNSGHLEEGGAEAFNFNDLLARAEAEGGDCARLERLKFRLERVRRSSGRVRPEEDEDPALSPEYLDRLLKKFHQP